MTFLGAPLPLAEEITDIPWLPAQLNESGFAYCLKASVPAIALTDLADAYHLESNDRLLPYLSFYPGREYPGASAKSQRIAFQRWSVAYDREGEALARRLIEMSATGPLRPAEVFKESLTLCASRREPVYCAALVTHNALRTLGRHGSSEITDPRTGRINDYNPQWFQRYRSEWLAALPVVQHSLIPLRLDQGGDRWGEWYHFFGIFTYSLHEMALAGNLRRVEMVVKLNTLLSPLLVGEPEDPVKAQLDRDAIKVARHFFAGGPLPLPLPDCRGSSAYVAGGRTSALSGEL